jgi:hypothetical protein
MAGGSRKNRGQHQPQQKRRSSASDNSLLKNDFDDDKASDVDFNKVLQEVEGSFQVTWREILMVIASIAFLAVSAICVGIAAGMTISIHYYENEGGSARMVDARDASSLFVGPNAYQRVTTLDPSIASSNVMQKEREGLDLGKVITTTASGQLNVLMVVEETTPLDEEVSGTSDNKSYHAYNANVNDEQYNMPSDSPSYASANGHSDTNGQHGYVQPPKAKSPDPYIQLRESKVRPTRCSDGTSVGFDNWNTFKAAVQEANSISAERFMKWNEFFANSGKYFAAFEDDSYYYEEDVYIPICPHAILKSRRGPIFINAENVLIECDRCIIDVGGTHLAFGPHAKNVVVRGVTFKNAHTSSMTFFHDGASASFEDCFWVDNHGIDGKYGAVADVNSTSTLNFYRCEIGQGRRGVNGMAPESASSLSIRN